MTERPDAWDGLDVVEEADASLLELVDHLLNQGVLVTGELVLGVAGVDLVYLRLQLLLAAADKVLPASGDGGP